MIKKADLTKHHVIVFSKIGFNYEGDTENLVMNVIIQIFYSPFNVSYNNYISFNVFML